ncbi:MAG: DUF2911 domain-containing protein [Bacteroidota bacterium]
MKKILSIALATTLLASFSATAQDDKSKRPSPPAVATETIKSGATVTIDYSQPSIKGRTIGKDLEPKDGQVWRAGANEATTFEVDKDVMVEGQALPKGKYSLFTIKNGDDWTIIFNKTAKQWGAYKYAEAEDQLRVKAKGAKTAKFYEQMTFSISKAGEVSLMWGDMQVNFWVK